MALWKNFVEKLRHNRKMLLFIVYVALFLDNMLLTTVVPIMPEYLYRLEHPNVTQLPSVNGKSTPRPTKTQFSIEKGREENYYIKTRKSDNENEKDEPKKKRIINRINITKQSVTKENDVRIGLMFGSKALIQLLINPFVGPLTHKIGYTIPMFGGFVIMFISTLVFAFGQSYGVLFFARALQGIGSACTSTSGLGLLAQAYQDDRERGTAMGIALGGLALGVILGPVFGGVCYELSGKALPFLILSGLALFDGALQLFILQPKLVRSEKKGTSIITFLKDPYIVIAAFAITIGNISIAMLEASLPAWMIDTMGASTATTGAAFLAPSISYLIGTNMFGSLATRIGRWLSAMIGCVIIGISVCFIHLATSVYILIAPIGFIGLAIGMIDASMFPHMGYLVDLRHEGVYGNIYAIADTALCFAFALGPFIGGPISSNVGFPAMLYVVAGMNFAYAPFLFFLRNPKAITSEKTHLLAKDDALQLRQKKFDESSIPDAGKPISTKSEYGAIN